jgi:hypothetical protein
MAIERLACKSCGQNFLGALLEGGICPLCGKRLDGTLVPFSVSSPRPRSHSKRFWVIAFTGIVTTVLILLLIARLVPTTENTRVFVGHIDAGVLLDRDIYRTQAPLEFVQILYYTDLDGIRYKLILSSKDTLFVDIPEKHSDNYRRLMAIDQSQNYVVEGNVEEDCLFATKISRAISDIAYSPTLEIEVVASGFADARQRMQKRP